MACRAWRRGLGPGAAGARVSGGCRGGLGVRRLWDGYRGPMLVLRFLPGRAHVGGHVTLTYRPDRLPGSSCKTTLDLDEETKPTLFATLG